MYPITIPINRAPAMLDYASIYTKLIISFFLIPRDLRIPIYCKSSLRLPSTDTTNWKKLIMKRRPVMTQRKTIMVWSISSIFFFIALRFNTHTLFLSIFEYISLVNRIISLFSIKFSSFNYMFNIFWGRSFIV